MIALLESQEHGYCRHAYQSGHDGNTFSHVLLNWKKQDRSWSSGRYDLQSVIPSQPVQLRYFCEERFFLPAHDSLMDARSQMIFYEEIFELLDGFAHCIGLAQNINAGGVLFYHSTNTAQVSFDVMYALEYILLVNMHRHPRMTLWYRVRSRKLIEWQSAFGQPY
jgi:hypothetical protein